MKREAINHPKMLDLSARLDVPHYSAVGIIEMLNKWVSDMAPQGNVGKWPDGAIARAVGWMGDPTIFVEALVLSGWIDRDETHRLVMHDWHEHCENWVRAKLQKAGLNFVGVDLRPTLKTDSYEPLLSGDSSPVDPDLNTHSFPRDPAQPSPAQPSPKKRVRAGVPPTVGEVADYCRERANGIDPEHFVAYYAARGWKTKSGPIADWRACVITWEKQAAERARDDPPEPQYPKAVPYKTRKPESLAQ